MITPESNPFAPPKAALNDIGGPCQRDGKWVLVPSGSDLPPRCIICNEPVEGLGKQKKLYWHSPWFYLLILVNPLIYVLIGLIVRRSIKVSPRLCRQHAARRRRLLLLFVGSGLALMFAGFAQIGQDVAALCFVLAIVLLIIAGFAGRTVYSRKITRDHARLGGCKEAFLASLERV